MLTHSHLKRQLDSYTDTLVVLLQKGAWQCGEATNV